MFSVGSVQSFEFLPAITSVPAERAQKQLVKKIRQCCICFDFGRPEALDAKESKRETLLEIVHYVIAYPNCLTADVYNEIRIMVDANVYRSLPPKLNPVMEEDPEEIAEPVEDLAWPHLHAVYELLLRVFESPNFNRKLAKDAFTENFALHLLQMLDSEDPRERDFLKMAIHRMYGKFVHLRTYMREQMGYMLQEYVANQPKPFSGISELLEILGSIVNGFAVPLKPTHVEYLKHVLLPLIKMPAFVSYYHPHLYCLIHFLVKDQSLALTMLRYFFRHYPVQTARKQLLVLGCVENIINSVDTQTVAKVAPLVFANLAKILRSPHFQVADRCLALLENDKVRKRKKKSGFSITLSHLASRIYPKKFSRCFESYISCAYECCS